ncbi:amino acid racemase [Aliikangiella marina]|uniref:Amino acid racemase n=1 Tax=Aliikangiella marina TaxID=1712262 RepID=A0A545T5E5_9GAMM|nr:amino acid racemase [Aliikangiella marina]TQV72388.1 amino acid racemase [Aliikangiella marina]
MSEKPIKSIGIVACSSEGAALCYRTICNYSAEIFGEHAHPEIAIHSHSLAKYVEYLTVGDLDKVAELMVSSAKKLKASGADFVICPDNTIHQAFDTVVESSPLEWLHIAEVVTQFAHAKGFKKLGILGTRWLVESQVYPEKLEANNIAWMRPSVADRNEIDKIIMHELVHGIFKQDSINYFVKVIERLQSQGCDSVILGCTEIPLIISDTNSPLPTLDSTRLLAKAAVDFASSQ